MNILKKIFGETPKAYVSKLTWIRLTEMSQLETIAGANKTIGIFKHSTRCITSSMVKKQFEKSFKFDSEQIDIYYLDLILYRDISNEIARKYTLLHESPQLLIIKKNKLVAEGSHSDILNIDLTNFI